MKRLIKRGIRLAIVVLLIGFFRPGLVETWSEKQTTEKLWKSGFHSSGGTLSGATPDVDGVAGESLRNKAENLHRNVLVQFIGPSLAFADDNVFTDDVKGKSGADVRLDEGMVDTPYGGIGRYENGRPANLIYRHGNLFSGLKLALDSLVHSLGSAARNPDFAALTANLNRDFFEEVEMVFYEAVYGNFLNVEFASTDSTQGVFHGLFSLLVFGSNHLAWSNQWTVII